MQKNTDIVIGLQWGDEGKGKIVDLLLSQNNYDVVIRANGGNNAGHSIKINGKEFAVHSLPSGMFQKTINIIGPGCVVNANAIIKEISTLGNYIQGELIISDKCPLILKKHIDLDKQQEKEKGSSSIGTTLKGIGPAYADLKYRTAIFAGDLLDLDNLKNRFSYLTDIEYKNLEAELLEYKDLIGKYIKNIKPIIRNARSILIEGAQATMLDNLYGSYPYVTSSSTIVTGLLMGSGLNHLNVNRVYGVTKLYSTRVGNGPFVTEMDKELSKIVRNLGNEIGVSTGRERRCGWIDLVQLKEAIDLNGVTDLCLIKSDVLDSFEEIKLCISYERNGEDFNYIPYSLKDIKPVYLIKEGWKEKTYQKVFKTEDEIPENLKNILKVIVNNLGVRITYLSTGPGREETTYL